MSTTLNDTMDTANGALDSARESTGHAVGSARSSIVDGVKAVSGIVAMLRDLGVNDALGWVGLSRTRSPLRGLAVFGAGVALGAGVGVLFAPMSGGDLRRAILGRLMGPIGGAKEAVKTEAREVGEGARAVTDAVADQMETAQKAIKDAGTAHGTPDNGHRPA
jgi:gas vesicle protein